MALQQRARAWRHPRFLVGAAIAVTFVATFCANVWVADRVVYEGGMLLARVLHKGHPVRRNLQESLLRDHRHYHSRHPPDVRGRPQQQMMIAWLMAFPNSGTSYASRFVRETTRTLSASNYADETQLGSLEGQRWPVFANQPDGPFWIKPDDPQEELMYKEPSRYILTKTHCGMRCTHCPPEKYGESTYSFRRRCLTTKWIEVKHLSTVDAKDPTIRRDRVFSEYQPHKVAKAVHLIRDPFDNIVSRYHLARQQNHHQEQQTNSTAVAAAAAAQHTDLDRDRFRRYCALVERQHEVNERRMAFLEDGILDLMRGVPCHEDLLRWIEWHNLAFITASDLELDEYVLYYESFGQHLEETKRSLLHFLELKQAARPPRFEARASYNYYTPRERERVKKAFEIMASGKTWRHIRHYFETEIERHFYEEPVVGAARKKRKS